MSALRPVIQASPDKGKSMISYMADLMDQLHDMHHYVCQHLKVARDRMKACYDHLANSAGFQEGDQMWLNCPTQTRVKSP
jgi:hypothetical protein